MNDNNTNNAAKNMKKNLVPVTEWIDAAEAKAKKAELIANGTYAKGQVTLSSYRWKDIKDHSKGYIARVMVDAEVAKAEDIVAKKVAKKKLKKSENVTTSGNSDCNALKLNYFCKRNKVDTDTTTA